MYFHPNWNIWILILLSLQYSSIYSKYYNILYRSLEKHLSKIQNEGKTTLAKRTIFAMNLNKSHFITIVIEDNLIYILNSL